MANTIVEIENLSFAYPDGRAALKNISLAVRRGEKLGVVGPNGSGKTTLLLHLNGVLRANGSSRLKVCGMPVEERNLREIRRRVGLVFQDPDDQLFSPTVFEDVAFGPLNLGCASAEVRQRVARALALVGMAGQEARSSHHLSAGEKKRAALATVLVLDPELLVLDEPSSSLDPAGKWSLIDLLSRVPVTRIVASHDLELIRALCDRVIILDRGEVVADSETAAVLANTALLRAHGLASPYIVAPTA